MPVWERAEQAAKQRRQSVSQIATNALREHLAKADNDARQSDSQEITVEVGDPPIHVVFSGSWLVEPDPKETRAGHDAGAYWGVALTSKRRYAVFAAHVNERWPPSLDDYDTLDDAEAGGTPPEILSRASAALGDVRPMRLDI